MRLRFALMRHMLGLVVAVAFILTTLAAGRSYLVCRTTNTVLDACCAPTADPAQGAALDAASCCDRRVHAAPGTAIQSPSTTALLTATSLPPSFGAPIAVLEPALVLQATTTSSMTWTGPPLDEQRARLSVLLL